MGQQICPKRAAEPEEKSYRNRKGEPKKSRPVAPPQVKTTAPEKVDLERSSPVASAPPAAPARPDDGDVLTDAVDNMWDTLRQERELVLLQALGASKQEMAGVASSVDTTSRKLAEQEGKIQELDEKVQKLVKFDHGLEPRRVAQGDLCTMKGLVLEVLSVDLEAHPPYLKAKNCHGQHEEYGVELSKVSVISHSLLPELKAILSERSPVEAEAASTRKLLAQYAAQFEDLQRDLTKAMGELEAFHTKGREPSLLTVQRGGGKPPPAAGVPAFTMPGPPLPPVVTTVAVVQDHPPEPAAYPAVPEEHKMERAGGGKFLTIAEKYDYSGSYGTAMEAAVAKVEPTAEEPSPEHQLPGMPAEEVVEEPQNTVAEPAKEPPRIVEPGPKLPSSFPPRPHPSAASYPGVPTEYTQERFPTVSDMYGGQAYPGVASGHAREQAGMSISERFGQQQQASQGAAKTRRPEVAAAPRPTDGPAGLPPEPPGMGLPPANFLREPGSCVDQSPQSFVYPSVHSSYAREEMPRTFETTPPYSQRTESTHAGTGTTAATWDHDPGNLGQPASTPGVPPGFGGLPNFGAPPGFGGTGTSFSAEPQGMGLPSKKKISQWKERVEAEERQRQQAQMARQRAEQEAAYARAEEERRRQAAEQAQRQQEQPRPQMSAEEAFRMHQEAQRQQWEEYWQQQSQQKEMQAEQQRKAQQQTAQGQYEEMSAAEQAKRLEQQRVHQQQWQQQWQQQQTYGYDSDQYSQARQFYQQPTAENHQNAEHYQQWHSQYQQWHSQYQEYYARMHGGRAAGPAPVAEPGAATKPGALESNATWEQQSAHKMCTEIWAQMSKMVKDQIPLDERKKSFKQLSLKWHPDKNVDNQEVSKSVFQFIQQQKEWFFAEL